MADLPSGRSRFRDLTSCVRLFPEPGGRDLAEVALADLAMTTLRSLDPTKAGTGYPTVFLNIGIRAAGTRYGIEP